MKALALFLFVVALRAQEVDGPVVYESGGKPAEASICGTKPTHTDADYVQVSCVDYDALRKYIPTTMTGKETQVLIHARKGRDSGTIYVSVDGVNYRKGTQTLLGGRLVTLITFPGVGYRAVEIDIP